MSISKWSYKPEKCDGEFCPGSCDKCPKASFKDGLPLWMVLELLKESEGKRID